MLVLLLLGGCADPEPVAEDSPRNQPAGARLGAPDEAPPARAVRIGEGGPRFSACQNRGAVGGLNGGMLAVRDAPFDRARQTGSIAEGTHVHICTRSLDQQWLGIVYPAPAPGAAADAAGTPGTPDCGVDAPVRAKRDYDGPCQSGWVDSTFVALVAR